MDVYTITHTITKVNTKICVTGDRFLDTLLCVTGDRFLDTPSYLMAPVSYMNLTDVVLPVKKPP